jgi:hypothetical protein
MCLLMLLRFGYAAGPDVAYAEIHIASKKYLNMYPKKEKN